MTILYALLVLIVTMLVATITTLYELYMNLLYSYSLDISTLIQILYAYLVHLKAIIYGSHV